MFTTGNGYNTARGFMTTPTKEQIDPCLNCDSATCMREYDYPCNDRIRYLYKLQKHERKRRN